MSFNLTLGRSHPSALPRCAVLRRIAHLILGLLGASGRSRRFVSLAFICTLAACASIPPEAPELSTYLGQRINAMESVHHALVKKYFDERRQQVDDFVAKEWIPEFSKQLFQDPTIANVWNEVVQSNDPTDRVRFLMIVGPKIQAKVNEKRLELVKPLDQLEGAVNAKLKAQYDDMRAVNNTLTSFLESASKVEENRKRYLDLIGVKETGFDKVIDQTDKAVSGLLKGAQTLQGKVQDAETYKAELTKLIDKVDKPNWGG